MKTLRQAYTDLHEGLPPDRMLSETRPALPKKLWAIGRVTEITYRKRVRPEDRSLQERLEDHPDGVLHTHKLASHAQPMLWRDDRGKLWIAKGKNSVSDDLRIGIIDLPTAKQTEESLPPVAKDFVDLGKLVSIRYRRDYEGRRETGTLEFDGQGPILAHHAGDLWLLRGNYSVKEGTEIMAKVARANPSGGNNASNSEKAKAVLMSAAGVGGTAALTVIAMNMVLPKIIKDPAVVAPATLTNAQKASTEYKRAAAELGLGLLAAVGVFVGIKAKGPSGHVVATVSGGLGAGAVVGSGLRAYRAYQMTRVGASAMAAGYIMPSLPSGYTAIYSQPNAFAPYAVRS